MDTFSPQTQDLQQTSSGEPSGDLQLDPRKRRAGHRILFLILFILAAPIAWLLWSMVSGSLLPLDELKSTLGPVLQDSSGFVRFPLLPAYPTLQPLLELLLDTPQFFVMFWNSFRIALISIAGQLVIATPAAWALSRLRFRGRSILMYVYIALMLMPFQVTMVPNYLTNNTLGLMDTHWSVIFPAVFSAFPVFIMSKSFDSVPLSILEAAKVDGAGHIRIFFSIGVPLGTPGILSALLLGFLEAWNAIEQPMLFLKTPEKWPLSLYLEQIASEKLGVALASSLLMLMPAALVFLFGQKYLILGIQSSGIKE